MNKTPKIALEEIIYEITGKCNNGCSYCGSKNQWNCNIDIDTIDRIVDAIAEYPPKAIDISGGDPLLVPLGTHKRLVQILKDKGVMVKILFNPKSFKVASSNTVTKLDTLKLYDYIGVSINEEEEINGFISKFASTPLVNKMTVITNFNINNVFLFDKISKLVVENNMTWQIQYTMYPDMDDKCAIYNNDAALQYLFDKITFSMLNGVKIILADDMNKGECTAGIKTIGILSDGDVVPCLSMRSWISDIGDVEQGNVLSTPLKDIWSNQFKECRFDVCKCCKDHCKNKVYEPKPVQYPLTTITEPCEKDGYEDISKAMRYGFFPRKYDKKVPIYPTPSITVYAVFPNEPSSVLYGVYNIPTITTRYVNNLKDMIDDNKTNV